MAQVLKEEIKKQIINEAMIEFNDKGFDNSSLRQIAIRSSITPGNLYRYFESKEALYEYVISNAYNKVETILKKATNNLMGFDHKMSREQLLKVQKQQVGKVADQIIGEIMDVFAFEKLALIIILKDDREGFSMNSRIRLLDWITQLFKVLYYDDLLAKDLSYSFIEGIIRIISMDDNKQKNRLSKFIDFYFARGLEENE